MFFSSLAAAPPAGGAAVGQIVIATVAAIVVTTAMLALAIGHRSGRMPWIERLSARAERITGLPGWASLPAAIVGASLLVALLGMYWDISLHIDDGRDPGPLANPAHYLILFGLFGLLFAAVAAIALPRERPGASAVRIAPGWHAPVGGVLLFACASFALVGFPLDDMWHRLFGQDVTLWGPTHLMLIGGASLGVIATLVLTAEGHRARGAAAPTTPQRQFNRLRTGLLSGGLLVALSTFQGEFDFGVPQFRLLFHPLLLALAAGIALVAARVHLGRGGALLAVGSFVVIRGVLSLIVWKVFGQSLPHLPLYLAEGAVVELAALAVGAGRPLRLGLLSGLGIGTAGIAAEWGWSHLFLPIPWPSALMPEAFAVGLPVALAAGTLGAWIGAAVTPEVPLGRGAGRAAAVAFAVLLAAVAWTLPATAGAPLRAQVTLHQVTPPPDRTVQATIRLDPADGARDALWFTATSWQGGGLVVDALRRVGPGVYETTRPLPVHGSWKTMLRLHRGNAIAGLPIYLPADPAIPAPAVSAGRDRFQRAFVLDRRILQRERKDGVPGWLTLLAYLVVLAIALSMAAALGWGLRRVRGGLVGGRPQPRAGGRVSGTAAPA